MRRFGKISTVLVCVMVVVCLFNFFTSSMAVEALIDHECCEGYCVICVLNAWHRSGIGNDIARWLLLVAIFVTLTLISGVVNHSREVLVIRKTPVFLKVKLLN